VARDMKAIQLLKFEKMIKIIYAVAISWNGT